MAFKTAKSYNEERYGGLFLLKNDGDYADVIFMYRDENDVLVADTHYIKSSDYSGYVHCCGRGCPACGKGIRVQTKLFIPLYNITDGAVQFWDRTMRFEPQLSKDVFAKYPNPSEFVFRITRHGVAGDVNTTYEIVAVGKNTFKSYSQILADNGLSSPDYYNNICKEMTPGELRSHLDSDNSSDYGSMPEYTPSPRVTAPISGTSATPMIPEAYEGYSVSVNSIESTTESPDIDSDMDIDEPVF